MRRPLLAVLFFGIVFGAAVAKAQDAPPQLGIDSGELTPMGAIRAGDQYRFVPEWTGGLLGPLRGQIPGEPPPDPFFDDSRWFTVSAKDITRYKDRLTAGQRELLKRFDSFEIALYPSHRTASAPKAVMEGAIANLGRARLENNGLVLAGAENGVPFPVPKTGIEAMWNHILRWRGGPNTRTTGMVVPDQYGKLEIARYREDWLPAYVLGLDAPGAVYYRRLSVGAAEDQATALSLRDSLDQLRRPRVVWYLPPKQKKPVLAPDFAYGTPDPASKGVRTADMLDMFSGPLDRFAFTLVGRKTMYMPYNAYRLVSTHTEPGDFLWAEHPNPGYLRYEMHRVWIVQALLKRGYRHPFPLRTYYLDEDSWQILAAEHYDQQKTLARYAEAHCIAFGEPRVFAPAVEFTYDFPGKRYAASGFSNRDALPDLNAKLTPADFDAAALVSDSPR